MLSNRCESLLIYNHFFIILAGSHLEPVGRASTVLVLDLGTKVYYEEL